MKRKRYSEDQIIQILKEAERGLPVAELGSQVWSERADGLSVEIEVRRSGGQRVEATQATGGGKPTTQEDRGRAGAGYSDAQGCHLKKLVKPAARRKVVRHLSQSFRVSLRRACGLIELNRSSYYYESQPANDQELRRALRRWAFRHRRWGYETLTELLRREGWRDNHKRIYRVYREEGLQVRRRKRKRVARWRGERLEAPQSRNEIWAMDFMSDQLADGRRLRVLPIIDIYTRECLAMEVDTSLTGERVVRVLDRLQGERGWPGKIVVDNGPEFRGKVMDCWAYEAGVKLHFIEPGKPMAERICGRV